VTICRLFRIRARLWLLAVSVTVDWDCNAIHIDRSRKAASDSGWETSQSDIIVRKVGVAWVRDEFAVTIRCRYNAIEDFICCVANIRKVDQKSKEGRKYYFIISY